MRFRAFGRGAAAAFIAAIATLAPTGAASAGSLTVAAGFDLFTTDPAGTSFNGVNFMGVPITSFNFGSGTVTGLGSTDTIVQRMNSVTVAASGDTGSTSIQIKDLQLESTAPVSGHNEFVTLQTNRSAAEFAALGAGSPSNGTMNITFASPNGGTFATSFFDVFFDVRLDSLNGPIVFSGNTGLDSSGNPWSHTAPTGAVLVNGVNNMLDGTDTNQDFWPGGGVHNGPHLVDPTTSPEPGSLVMVSVGVACVAGTSFARRRRRARG